MLPDNRGIMKKEGKNMGKNFKRFCSLLMVSAMLMGCGIVAFAEENGNVDMANECEALGQQQADEIFAKLKQNLENYYSGLYTFDNFRIKFISVENEPESVDVTLIADMTLIRDPKDAPNVRGMIAAISQLSGEEKDRAQAALDEYLESVMPYYNLPVTTGFEYRVEIPPVTYSADAENAADLELYSRTDTEEGALLTPVDDNAQFQEISTPDDGAAFIADSLSSDGVEAYANPSFNASAAVQFAVANAMEPPEFSKDGNSDCANFVSKSLCAGGIPEDESGKWYRASTWGNTGTCGINWMRTGSNGTDGVMIYMRDKYWFQLTPSGQAKLGSIVFWNRKSHVAIVTLLDGTTIKYSDHSNYQKDYVYKAYSYTDNVSFYSPRI